MHWKTFNFNGKYKIANNKQMVSKARWPKCPIDIQLHLTNITCPTLVLLYGRQPGQGMFRSQWYWKKHSVKYLYIKLAKYLSTI